MSAALAGPDADPLLGDRQLGFSFAMSHLLGIAFARHLTQVPHIAELDFESLVRLVSPATQQYLTVTMTDEN
ncbi:TetR/AcrR family transcriptional regulator [Arthrobacter psychrolactophilus]